MFCPEPLSILICIVNIFQAFQRYKPPIVLGNNMIIFPIGIKCLLTIILNLFIGMLTFEVIAYFAYLKGYPFQFFILGCFHLNVSELKVIILLLFVILNLSKHTFAPLLFRVIKLAYCKK